MSKGLDYDSLIQNFPFPLSGTKKLAMLASLVAESLIELYNDNDLLAIYTRIDELDSDILDILAYDFKIDWWDVENTVEEKRAVFKSCWDVHRKLGTPGAVQTAISSIYDSAKVKEWYEYGGKKYHFKISINLDNNFMDEEQFQRVLNRAKYYVNLRSVMDSVTFSSTHKKLLYAGVAYQGGAKSTYSVSSEI